MQHFFVMWVGSPSCICPGQLRAGSLERGNEDPVVQLQAALGTMAAMAKHFSIPNASGSWPSP